jgi:hypothetical protein
MMLCVCPGTVIVEGLNDAMSSLGTSFAVSVTGPVNVGASTVIGTCNVEHGGTLTALGTPTVTSGSAPM